jgi:hypothetical protein
MGFRFGEFPVRCPQAVVLRVRGFTLAELLTRALSRTHVLTARLVGTARDGPGVTPVTLEADL